MNVEDLTKSQLLLLMVLVNFVVSIATGVLTVSLLSQAPTTVTQTVNKIVDHTINTISTPIQIVGPRPAIIPATLSNEQLLTASVSAEAARSVLIYKGSTTTPAIAFGVYLPKSRAIATATVKGLPQEATIVFANGTSAAASISKGNDNVTIYGFSDAAKLPDAPAAVLTKAATLKAGQTVIALSKDSDAITGIISRVDSLGIHSSLSTVPVGAGVVDLNGSVVGIGSVLSGTFISADMIAELLTGSTTTPLIQ
jgi:hypothetical protein